MHADVSVTAIYLPPRFALKKADFKNFFHRRKHCPSVDHIFCQASPQIPLSGKLTWSADVDSQVAQAKRMTFTQPGGVTTTILFQLSASPSRGSKTKNSNFAQMAQ